MNQNSFQNFILTIIFLGIVLGSCSSAFAINEQFNVEIAGEAEVVYQWTKDKCRDEDIPDAPVRALRDYKDNIALFATHFINYRWYGPTWEKLEHSCEPIMNSSFQADPAKFNDHEWLYSFYSEDGKNVFALVHNEYQGSAHPKAGYCPSGEYNKCWYNSITSATSNNGGKHFYQAKGSKHLVATIPYALKRGKEIGKPVGIFTPSNIIKKDGYYFALVAVEEYQDQKSGSCLIRADKLDAKSWRAWDGQGFNVSFVDPFSDRSIDSGAHVCTPISPESLGKMTRSLVYSPDFNRYIAVGESRQFIPERKVQVQGIFYSTSEDLIHWSEPRLLMEAPIPWLVQAYGWRDKDIPAEYAYPSIVDHQSQDRNFNSVNKEAYLYLTRFNKSVSNPRDMDRDLIRIPIRLFKTKKEEAATPAGLQGLEL